jgi:hypothetical protein
MVGGRSGLPATRAKVLRRPAVGRCRDELASGGGGGCTGWEAAAGSEEDEELEFDDPMA